MQIPDTLPGTIEELAALREEAINEFRELYDEDAHPTEAELTQLEKLADLVDSIDEKTTTLEAENARAEGAKALADRVNKAETNTADEHTTGNEGPETTGTPDHEDTGNHDDTVTAEDTTTEAETHTAATSSSRPHRTEFSRAARNTTPPNVPDPTTGWRLTTSAKNFETGIVDSLRVAEEFQALAHGRSARILSGNGRSETTLAYLDRQMPSEYTIGDQADAIRVLDEVTNENRLPGGSLVAAGGWCAPSETIYEFLPTGAPGDLLSLPEVAVRRGGIKFPKEPDFSTVYDAIGFHQTETQAQSKTEKTCYEIPCSDFEELRLDVQGICITGGILQDKAWPELTRKYVDEALRLHQHKINAWRINKIVEGSTAVTGITGTFGTAGAVLSTIELQVADLKARHRIASNTSVEGFAPVWLRSIIRADLAYRDEVLPQQVTDADIDAHFRNLGANIQFVGDWQNDVIGGSTAPKAWPTTVDVVLYPAGTWYSALEPVINLGVTYDATLLKTNQRIQMFTEDGVAVGKRGPESRKITIPVTVNGEVGARHNTPAA